MAFNLKKHAAAADTSMSTPKQLQQKREEWNQKEPDQGTTERQLASESHKEKDGTVPFNKQLEAARTGTASAILEGQLNDAPKLFNERRDDRAFSHNVTSNSLVAEAYHQQMLKAYKASQKQSEKDTSFWDKQIGVSAPTGYKEQVSPISQSQLANHPDRFKGIKPDLSQSKEVTELVTAKLETGDKMMFHIFASAAFEGRKLTASEMQTIHNINYNKALLLTAQAQVGSDPFTAQPLPGEVTPMAPGGPDPVAQQQSQQEEGYATIVPSQTGHKVIQYTRQNGQMTPQDRGEFASEQEAHDFMSRDPQLADLPFKTQDEMAQANATNAASGL